MAGETQPDFRNAALDANLLSIPYRAATNWHVITGAPSCGKTTLITLLAERGYRTVAEGARLYMEREIGKGRTLEEIRANQGETERSMAAMQLEIEGGLQDGDRLFLDRAIPDYLAWYRFFGLNPNELLQDCFRHRYASVFILEQLPLHQDGMRYKDDALIGFTDAWHMRDYSALGYNVTRVPVLPPEERVRFVLSALGGQALV